ncbi:MAG: PepSY domain-containing protein [Planctomycetes bacterium]|nr:PepSY domain-containing protein [Planctomycetota bacterium]
MVLFCVKVPYLAVRIERPLVAINVRIWTRKGHRWGAIMIALPFIVVIVTGILLQLKKEWSWVQPPTQRGKSKTPTISLDAILDAAKSASEAGVQGWSDVERLDIQPNRGIAKVQAISRWEVQVDLHSGKVLQTAYRRSDLIESLHDGSWFHDRAKLWLFLPVAIVVLGLWATGIYLFFLPYRVRWARRREETRKSREQGLA